MVYVPCGRQNFETISASPHLRSWLLRGVQHGTGSCRFLRWSARILRRIQRGVPGGSVSFRNQITGEPPSLGYSVSAGEFRGNQVREG
jgi:hypothetical protein